jgi:hypothetical protein
VQKLGPWEAGATLAGEGSLTIGAPAAGVAVAAPAGNSIVSADTGAAAESLGVEGISIRTLAAAAGLSPSRVHQIVAAAGLDALDAAPGELRAAGWPAPEDPDSGEDTELGGRDTIAGRLSDEVSWLRQCAGWLSHLDADSCRQRPACARPPAGQTGPSWPPASRGWRRSSTASPLTWTNSPGPGGPRT